MKLSSIWLFSLLPLAAACAGSGGGSRAVPQSNSAPFGSQRLSEAASEATVASKATPVPVSSDLLYVANAGSNSITIYHHDAEGNTPPIATIAGSKTGLSGGGQLSEDTKGTLYVNNGLNILEFAHGAHGNVAPVRILVISGNSYLPSQTSASAAIVDPATGKLFVNISGSLAGCPSGQPEYVARFPPNATGNAAPYAVSEETCLPPYPSLYYLFALDSTGRNLIAPHDSLPYDGSSAGVDEFVTQFANGKSLNYTSRIYAFYGDGIVDDPTTKTYLMSVASVPGSIIRLKEGTSGSFYDSPPTLTPPLVSTITTATACSALALGYLRNIYAVCGTNTVNVYEHDASGAAKPIRVLSGSKTLLDNPVGIYEGK